VARVSTTAFSSTECSAGGATFPGGSALIQCVVVQIEFECKV